MKKSLFILMVISLAITSCVSQKKYTDLQHKCFKETARSFWEKEQAEASERMCKRVLKHSQASNSSLKKENMILKREVGKYIKQDEQHQSECSKLIVDSAGVYITLSSLDSASSATAAMVLAYDKVRDSLISVCEDVIFETINRYTEQVNLPFDSIHLSDVWDNAIQNLCNDVWQDSQNTYWALEVQKINWKDLIDAYIALTEEEERNNEELIQEMETEEVSDLLHGFLEEAKEKTKRKLNKELFAELYQEIIVKKYK